MDSPAISIIIPCYNSGIYLPDALKSIIECRPAINYEIIIIDDGSTDPHTLSLLNQLQEEGYAVYHQENKGPAAARNTGVKYSKYDFLLFLDCDNKIRSTYIEKGVAILTEFEDVGIVYANPSFFGDSSEPRYLTGEFEIYRLLYENYIDMCSIVRKKLFKEVGEFDEERSIIGHEDWELWIRAHKAGWKFSYINETLFDYRITRDSLVNQATHPEKHDKMFHYVYAKHLDIFMNHYKSLYMESVFYKRDQKYPFRSFIKFLFLKYSSSRKRNV